MRGAVVRFVVGCFILIAAAAARADDRFVNNTTGDDRADGRQPTSSSAGGPVRTIGRALATARPGDRIHLANTGVPYRESISLAGGNHCGFTVSPFTIFGNGAVLDGSLPVPPVAWEAVGGGVFRFQPPHGGASRLFIDSRPAVRREVDSEGRMPKLQPGEWCRRNGWLYFAAAADKMPRDYQLAYAALPVGVTLYQVHHVAVLDLTVQGFQIDGVNAHDGVRAARIGGLVLRGNGRSGLAVGGSSQLSADGCLLGDNAAMQVLLSGYGALNLQECELLETSAPKLVRRGGRLFADGVAQP